MKAAPRRDSWRPRDAAPAFRRGYYAAPVRSLAARGWQQLCDNERDSVIAATMVMGDLARLGAPPPILGAAARVIEDEVRHVEVCATVIEALGGDVSAPSPETTRANLGDRALEDRCAFTLIAGFAAGEPLSAACFAAARTAAREPLVRWAYTELLRDEARHGGFGVDAATWVVREWTSARRGHLFPACVVEMQAFEKAVAGHRTTDTATERSVEALGYLPRPAAHGAMLAAIPRWVLPALQRLGVIGGGWRTACAIGSSGADVSV